MPLPITIPNQFANATTSIPLSELDANFNTVAIAVNSIGNGAYSLANVTITGGSIANVSLDNVSVDIETLSNVTINNLTVNGNATFSNATITANLANITTANISNSAVISVNTSGDALRITQIGTGNALLVEDSTNPDSTPIVVDAAGLMVLGATSNQGPILATGNAKLQILGGTAPLAFYREADSITPMNLEFAKARAGGAILNSGDTIGRLYFSGSDGTAQIPAAYIDAAVDGTPGTNDMPGRLVFSTTADGAATPTERMRINSSGNVGIGTSSLTAPLTISAPAATVDVARLYSVADGGVQSESGIGFNPGTVSVNPAARISALELDASDYRASLLFYTRDSNSDVAPTERLRITSTGALAVNGSTNYGTAGQVLTSAGNAAPVWTDQFLSITYVFSNIGAGDQGDLTVPFDCTITEWTLLADVSGSAVIDIWEDTYANYPPTVADTITGSAKPTISASTKGSSSTLTGWTTTIAAGSTLRFNVDSASTLSRVTLSLKVKRT